VSELVDYLYRGKGKEMQDMIILARLLCEDDDRKRKIADLANCMENNFHGLYGSRSLKDKDERPVQGAFIPLESAPLAALKEPSRQVMWTHVQRINSGWQITLDVDAQLSRDS
jgi:hypothetical protein